MPAAGRKILRQNEGNSFLQCLKVQKTPGILFRYDLWFISNTIPDY